ncbi:protein-L-isoaspartate(D-aspartate) O-methyltransferase [Massilia sp. W12]|uniref:protein-L-isoaspartate(D-aspartate) O-methyltransferase n=1 Tax=Massilia sp. W12 TaxID=3126507 RepID=UPI0030D28515
MNGRGKQFPLPLAAVVSGKSARDAAIATPQTATRNALDHPRPKSDWRPPAPKALDVLPERSPQNFDAIRRAMVQRLLRQGVRDELTLAAMDAVPRHLFIDPALSAQAYIDASIPIGHQQTISQPYIVARMLEILRNGRQLQRVLEIGTGCGYQAAVLSQIAREVYSIERIKPLHDVAKTNLRPLQLTNIRLHYGDGMLGLPQAAPFDGIILAAAGLEVPPGLLQQLAPGGRLVAPVGGKRQVLQLIERVSHTEWSSETLEECHFVPLCSGTT